ncbi:hypothetical protein [Flagellimonas flava]|uniref:hypothetical protein n=1 Tax=Flagellimonas flava TaxID=570519 RepID=UPI003D650D33
MKLSRICLLFYTAITILLFSCYSDDGVIGPPGEQGENGYHCWDLNMNGINDPEEDVNGDGTWNSLDCLGQDGLNGADGINCWDSDGDWFNDEDEDVNNDGLWNALDCQGEDGNANVQKIVLDFENASIENSVAEFSVPELTMEKIQNYVLVFYLEYVPVVNSSYYPIPGGLADLDRSYNVVYEHGKVYIVASNFDGSDTNPGWLGYWDYLHIAFIKISALNDEDELAAIKSHLSESGINSRDFDALAPYFDNE